MLQHFATYRLHTDSVENICFLSQNDKVLTSSHVYTLTGELTAEITVSDFYGTVQWTTRDSGYMPNVAASTDGRYIVWGSECGRLRIFNPYTPDTFRELAVGGQEDTIQVQLYLALYRAFLVRNLASEDTWWLWDAATNWPSSPFPIRFESPVAASFDDKYLAIGHLCNDAGDFSKISLVNLATQQIDAHMHLPSAGVGLISFNSDASFVAASNSDSEYICVWDFSNILRVQHVVTIELPRDTKSIFSWIGERLLLIVTESGLIQLWNLSGEMLHSVSYRELCENAPLLHTAHNSMPPVESAIRSLVVSPYRKTLAIGTYNGYLSYLQF
jgi:WD40 repeat protein